MGILLFAIYDIIFILGFFTYLPIHIWHKKINFSALKGKLGFISLIKKNSTCGELSPELVEGRSRTIWIQAVSVGEVYLIQKFIQRLKSIYDYPIVISTTTLAGYRLAQKIFFSSSAVIFFPLDLSFVLKKMIKQINPKIFISIETEIWPNLFYNLKNKNIPIVILNGRISDRAFRRYEFIKPMMKNVLDKCEILSVQDDFYKKRFIELGAPEKKIVVTGSMKFENITIKEDKFYNLREKYTPILKRDKSLLIIAGSTHNHEEEIILEVFYDVVNTHKNISLLIAPRHIERVPSIEKIIASYGFNSIKISDAGNFYPDNKNIFILDTVGELLYFYGIADICFVGGSLINHGGHNILEPIYFLKPTIFGPFMGNFRDIEEVVLKKKAGIKVRSSEKFKKELMNLIENPSLRKELELQCVEVFKDNKNSLESNLEIIAGYLK